MAEKTKNKKTRVEYCPDCNDEIMIQLKSGDIEVFECKNCKFKQEKKRK